MSRYNRKRHMEQDPDIHDRWMVSYADFITLLFAFFVVMYAISISQEGSFRTVSDSIEQAFNPEFSEKSKRDDSLTDSDGLSIIGLEGGEGVLPETELAIVDGPELSTSMEKLQELASQGVMVPVVGEVEQTLQSLIDEGSVTITSDDLWMQIDIESNVLFDSGFAALHQAVTPTMRALAGVLNKFPHSVQVEGYTDNVPIKNEIYPSNWELSAARAASVVHLFSQNGLDPQRMSAVGFGEFRPVADNETPSGRAKNRRVAIIVLADSQAGRLIDIQQQLTPSQER